MAPPSSSKGAPKNTNTTSEGLQPPVSSLSSSSSRPRSILNVSHSNALSPSLSSHTPLNQLSTSPSSGSIVSNGGRNGAGGAGEYSALKRLKRVASNASIASSSMNFLQKAAAISSSEPAEAAQGNRLLPVPSATVERATSKEDETQQISSKQENDIDKSSLAPPPILDSQSNESTSNSTIMKRPRSPPARIDASANKQARRKTWFGFGGALEDDGDVAMEGTSAREAEGDQTKTESSTDAAQSREGIDVEMTDAEGQDRKPEPDLSTKSWVPWRAPAGSSTEVSQAQASYTDTIRRYVSGASTQNTIPWNGWPLWRMEPAPQHNQGDAPEAEMNSTKEEEEARSSTVEQNFSQNDATTSSTPTMLSRWWPAWTAEQSKSQDQLEAPENPPTPAEQVKAEALARMGAKDAVLNDATRSTWINYFSSRSALPFSRVEDKDRGPEVMKIEFPSSQQLSSSKQPPSVKVATKGKEKDLVTEAGKPATMEKGEGKRGPMDKPKDPAPPISRPSTPLTNNKDTAKKVIKAAAAPRGHKGDGSSKLPKGPPPPNLLLPSFDDTFTTAPRSIPPSKGMIEKTLSYLFSRPADNTTTGRARTSSLLSIGASRGEAGNEYKEHEAQTRLPRMWSVVGDKERALTKGCKGIQKVSVIGVHGWFSQGPLRNLFGEPTGTSIKFATMMSNAVREHFEKAGQVLSDDQLSVIALEADGQVADRVNKSFSALLSNPKWLADVLSSDVVFIAAHSQGCIVATHLLARLIEQRHLDPKRTRVALLAMCGIHHGPFTHLRNSVATYYFNTFETPAAKELFEYQNSKSPVSMMYAAALRIVINAGVKLIYVASMDDQVVPLYSALNSSASHPSILRAIFCDGAAFPRVDFLTNLLSFCAAVRNAGLSDHNLLTLLSASVAGSLYGGAGHSIVYEESQVYSLAVRYLMEVTSPASHPTTKSSENQLPKLIFEPFSMTDNAKLNNNPFALPWSLRGLLEDEKVRKYFDPVIDKLLKDYNDWAPTTKTLKDVQFRLEPMRLVSRQASPSTPSASKL